MVDTVDEATERGIEVLEDNVNITDETFSETGKKLTKDQPTLTIKVTTPTKSNTMDVALSVENVKQLTVTLYYTNGDSPTQVRQL